MNKGFSKLLTMLGLLAVTLFGIWSVSAKDNSTKGDTKGAAVVTFSKDVAPIVFARCAECHRPGESAPMSFMSYKEIRPWAKSIREVVAKREMPPWHADPHFGEFANDRRMTDAEVEKIKAWVDSGSREGDPRDLPPAPKFDNSGWKFGPPDVILSMNEEVAIPRDGTVPYKYWAVPTNFTEDKYVQFAEIRRGDPSVVHHVIVSVREPDQGPLPAAGEIKLGGGQRVNPEQADQQRAQRPRGTNPDGMLLGWAPGMTPLTLRNGTAKVVKKGSVLVFQLHYTTTGVASRDKTSIALWFSKTPVEKRMITKGVSIDPGKLVIPAGESNYEAHSSYTFEEDAHIYMFMPHMHVRGKDFEYKVVYPDGTSKVLLSVPKFDFNWQLVYRTLQPVAIPKGSRIECTAHYDNSARNKFNPDPSMTIRWGDQTWEEMMIGWLDYTIDKQNLQMTQSASK